MWTQLTFRFPNGIPQFKLSQTKVLRMRKALSQESILLKQPKLPSLHAYLKSDSRERERELDDEEAKRVAKHGNARPKEMLLHTQREAWNEAKNERNKNNKPKTETETTTATTTTRNAVWQLLRAFVELNKRNETRRVLKIIKIIK